MVITKFTFFEKVQPILSAATWTNRGVTPIVKLFSKERRQGMIDFGILLENLPKKEIAEISGTVVYENLVGIIHAHDTKQANLDKIEKDLKVILPANFGMEYLGTLPDTPGENSYGFQMRISVFSA